ncbi:MAG: DUF1318 domain-containing protein [Candidatus Hydrogenedentes bacterium]|nr:DUF1318 domain-containing protein [Candidatus Hydrogenedentota bacterium]
MKKYVVFGAVVALTIAWGCVIRTEHKIDAHITLDIRHVADQAEDVLDFIEGKTDALPGVEEVVEPESTSQLQRVMNALNPVQPVYAAELSVTTSPLIREIATSMRTRNTQVDAMKKKGCLGESNRGYVKLRDCDAVKDAEQRNKAQKLVADENKDRKALYAEMARLNRKIEGINVTKVEGIFAMQRLERAKSGRAFQLPPAGADFNKIKGSAVGKKLGSACAAGAWVTIP